jgi:flavodoxin
MSKTLVAYFSNSGRTAKIADIIIKETNADSYRIEPKVPYSGLYDRVLDRAQKELESNELIEIIDAPENIDEYDTVFLGTPNWWQTVVPPVRSFLAKYDFTDKTIYPFCTHAKGGYGNLISDLQNLIPSASVKLPFEVLDTNINESDRLVYNWLHKISVK